MNDQAVGFGDDLSDFPYAVVRHRRRRQPFQMYAQSDGGGQRAAHAAARRDA